MPQLLTVSSTLACPHQGTVSIAPADPRVQADGEFVVTAADVFTIVGCTFNIGSSPHPCVLVQWQQTAARNALSGAPALNDASIGFCVAADNAVQGTVQISATQARVSGV